VPFADLQSFVAELERRGQLKRVPVEVDPILEVAAIADRVSKSTAAGAAPPPSTDPVHGGRGGCGLLFERVKGSGIPLAINLYGSYERMRIALGCADFEELAARVQALVKPEMPTTFLEKLKKLPDLARLAGFGRRSSNGGFARKWFERTMRMSSTCR